MIRAINITKCFGDVKALDGVYLNVAKGSVCGLLGENGAGKTTLIKLLSGIYTPDEGECFAGGKKIYNNPEVKSKVIYIGDDPFFFPSYTIKNCVTFYRDLYPTWSDERFEKLKDIFQIDTNLKVSRLSKGMQKQVAFWLAISSCPEVIILDEPVDGLDAAMRRNLWKIILQDVAERSLTVLISSHNLRELEDVCDHVAIIQKGKIILDDEIFNTKDNFCKLQVTFENEFPKEIANKLKILSHETLGKLHTLVVKGNHTETVNIIEQFSTVLLETITPNLEDIFMYESGGDNDVC